MDMKRNIAIVAGGDSSEHDVSLCSAAGIFDAMDHDRYTVYVVTLRGSDWQVALEGDIIDGKWHSGRTVPVDKNDFSFTLEGRKTVFDFAYITIHGTPGENGLLQGYFDMLHVPYSCCGVLAAALTFNKYMCNHYLSGFGVRIAPDVLLRKGQPRPTDQEIVDRIGLPCFIKSNVGGSSFGCTKVKTLEAVAPAIERAFAEGDEVICEAFMQGVEITCGVYKTRQSATALPITEVVSKREFFDYDAKYNGAVEEITPARIPDEVRDSVQALTARIYDLLGCRGIIRVDYILTEGWTINLLEVNTTPGMTATSFVPQQIRAAGKTVTAVLTELIEDHFA